MISQDFSPEALTAALEANEVATYQDLGRLLGARVEGTPECARVVTPIPDPAVNRVMRVRLDPGADVDTAIERALLPFREGHLPLMWSMWPPAAPALLDAPLRRHGLAALGPRAAMALDLRALPAATPPAGLSVERVGDRATMRRHTEALAHAIDLSPPLAEALADAHAGAGFPDAGPWHHFLGIADGTPVAVAAVFLGAGVAGVYSVGTVPAAQRRGYGAAVTLAALHHARDIGYRIGALWASAQGESVYRRLGFLPFGQIVLWSWSPSP